jgi:heme-degrading monooxygenase HmoA
MFTRVVQFKGAKDIEAGVAFVRDTVTPVLRQQKGFRGVTASADRSAGVVGVLTLWDSEADRDASESALNKVRNEGAKIIGGEMTVEMYEEMVLESVGPPRESASLLIRRISMDPAKIDDNLEFFKETVLPQIKASPGFLAVRHMINRSTGDGIVGSVWTDAASMNAAAQAAQQRQAQAEGRVSFGEQSKREVLFVEIV